MSLLYAGASPKTIVYASAHNHPCYEIILNTVGQGIATVGDREYKFAPNSILVVPPNMSHTKSTKDGFRDIYLHTDTLFPVSANGASDSGFSVDCGDDDELCVLIRMIFHRYVEGNKNDTALTLMYELFMQLLAEKCTLSQLDPTVEAIRQRLTVRFNDPELSLADILSSAPYHKDHIRRRFISAYGVTPGEYLTNLRIENAKNLLQRRRELGLSVAQIGEMCGYYDGHYFSRVFKSRTGTTPSEYMQ